MAAQKPNSGAADSLETEIGKFVVDQRLATQAEVDECLALLAMHASQDSTRTLSEVLVEQGVVTGRQIQRLKSSIEETRGQQIPGYQILSRLGAGAMATVFKARQLSLDRIVAIKVLPKKFSESPDYVARFYKEGKAAARLNHPNIVQAYDVGEAGGYHYFVMEYVEGHTLFDELAEGKVFSEQEALKVIIQIARALAHAHKQGLIHRDVKPKNIMIAKDGTAKLADMGLARGVSDVVAAQAEAGKAFGTPYYISPEQIRGEVDIDFRADIYSLGATLYHMVTGRVPFEAPTPAAVMHKHLKEPLVPPDHVNTKLSAGLGEAVEVMMAKDRNRRYASTEDMLVDLQAIAVGEPPLQARKRIDSAVLSGLAEEVSRRDQQQPTEPSTRHAASGNLWIYLIILASALAASVIANVILLLLRA